MIRVQKKGSNRSIMMPSSTVVGVPKSGWADSLGGLFVGRAGGSIWQQIPNSNNTIVDFFQRPKIEP